MSSVTSSVLALDPESKVAARRPMMLLELCLIFSGGADTPSTSSVFVSEEGAGKGLLEAELVSGLKSAVGEVRLLALPVELNKDKLVLVNKKQNTKIS